MEPQFICIIYYYVHNVYGTSKHHILASNVGTQDANAAFVKKWSAELRREHGITGEMTQDNDELWFELMGSHHYFECPVGMCNYDAANVDESLMI